MTTGDSAGRERAVSTLERHVLGLLAEDAPLADALEELARGLERISSPGLLASVLLLDADRGRLQHGAAPSLPPAYNAAIHDTQIGAAVGSCGTAAFRAERVVVTDIERDPLWSDFRSLAAQHGLRACWSDPILSGDGRVLGTVALYYREPRAPSPEDLDAIASVARLARIIVEREHAARARNRAAKREAAQLAAARVLAESEKVGDALTGTLAGVAAALGWEAAAIWLPDAATRKLACVAQWTSDPAALQPFVAATTAQSLSPGQGLPGRVFVAGEPEWLVVPRDHPSFPRGAPAAAVGLRTGFALPVTAGHEHLGAIELYTTREEPVDADLLRTLSVVGMQVGQLLRRARAQEERERLVGELRDAVRYSEIFAGILGHDLRNPLTAILTGTALLLRRGDDDRSRPTLERVQASGKRMARMIDQLLDLTRARIGGGIAIARKSVDLADVARTVVSEIELAFPQRRVTLQVEGDTRGEWDGDRLAQVFANLLCNAIQHGTADRPIVFRIDGRDAGVMRFEVQNGGVIPATSLPWVFDPFRSGRTADRTSEGLGLGLYITQQIVRAHGGEITVESTPEEGTRFRAELARKG